MITEFALDLRHARRKSGLSQTEVAFLLATNQATYSRFEQGAAIPTLEQLCSLALIYGKSFSSYFTMITRQLKPDLWLRLQELPAKERPRVRIFNRARTLERLRLRLDPQYGEA